MECNAQNLLFDRWLGIIRESWLTARFVWLWRQPLDVYKELRIAPRIPIHARAVDEAQGVGLGVAADGGIVSCRRHACKGAMPVVMQALF